MISNMAFTMMRSKHGQSSIKILEKKKIATRNLHLKAKRFIPSLDSTPGAISNKNSWSNSIKLVEKKRIFETDQPVKRLRNFRSDNPFTDTEISSFLLWCNFTFYFIRYTPSSKSYCLIWFRCRGIISRTLDSSIKNSFLSIICNRNPYPFPIYFLL